MSNIGPLTDDFVFIPGYIITGRKSASLRSWVYEGIDREDLETIVSIEVAQSNDQETRQWYARIENTYSHLEHPHIPLLLRSGSIEGFPYLVFDRLPVTDLTTLVQENCMQAPQEALSILRGVADVLDYAHERGVLHGDLHARKIGRAEDGWLGVTGFGDFPPPETIGNPHHYAPEQLSFDQFICPQSDVYALGELAYFLFSGKYPFQTVSERLLKPKAEPKVHLHDLRHDLPLAVDRVIARAMAADPEDRFPTAGQFVRSLELAFHHDSACHEEEPEPHWRTTFDHLLATVIDPAVNDKDAAVAMEELAHFSCLDLDDYAPLLANLDRFVQFLVTPNDRVQQKMVEIAGLLGMHCSKAILKYLSENRFVLDDEELRYCLLALMNGGGIGVVSDMLVHHPDPCVRKMAAFVLRQADAIETVGHAFQQGFKDPVSDVREASARGYLIWLNQWATSDLFERLPELIVPLLQSVSVGESNRRVFANLIDPTYPLVVEIARQMQTSDRLWITGANDGRVTAAFALRYFPLYFENFQNQLQRAMSGTHTVIRDTAKETFEQLTLVR